MHNEYGGTPEPGPVNAYVFVQGAEEGGVERLAQLVNEGLKPAETGARFLFPLLDAGPDQAMLVVQASDLQSLQEFILTRVRADSSLQTTTYAATSSIIDWIKLLLRRMHQAIVRCRVGPKGNGSLADEVRDIPAYMAGAWVLGDVDYVLEFGAATREELEAGLEQLRALGSVTDVVIARAEFPDAEGAAV